jgi:hypothetical protein
MASPTEKERRWILQFLNVSSGTRMLSCMIISILHGVREAFKNVREKETRADAHGV